MSLAWGAYRLAAPALGLLAPAARLFVSPHERVVWRERLGEVSLPGGCHAWVHAASLGESAAVPPLLRELERRQPGARFYLTATTRSGRARLAAIDRPVSLAPFDAPQTVRRFLRGIQPRRILLLETELWPHWLMRARRDGIPVAIVSARLSERSVARYRRLGGGLRSLVGSLAGVLCQSDSDVQRWLALGAAPARTSVVGNLKSDALPAAGPGDRAAARAALGLDGERPLLVLGSLRPGEVRPIVRALRRLPAELRARWQVVAVPRHARATTELRDEARDAGLAGGAASIDADHWRWEERTGVLVRYYVAADVAFVGGSLARYGGHNPLEAAACGAAVVMGPHFASQREYVAALERHGAIAIANGPESLAATFDGLLRNEPLRRARSLAGEAAAREQRGSAARAVDRLQALGLWPAT